jgi:hypothetical protein
MWRDWTVRGKGRERERERESTELWVQMLPESCDKIVFVLSILPDRYGRAILVTSCLRIIRRLFRKHVSFRSKKWSKFWCKILLLSDSTFFNLLSHIFAAIIEALIVAGHKFLCALIECGRLRC